MTRRRPPELDYERLVSACGSSTNASQVQNVLDAVCPDEWFGHDLWLCTAVALRALLAPHQPTEAGKCGQCASHWPCWSWREAHDWICRYDPIHGRRVYDWIHHEAGAEDSVGLDPAQFVGSGGVQE